MSVRRDDGEKAPCQGATNGGIHAIVGGATGDDQSADACCSEPVCEIGIQKSIATGFAHELIVGLRPKLGQKTPTRLIGIERVSLWPAMLHPYHYAVRRAHPLRQSIDASNRACRVMLGAGEQASLHVDDDQGCAHQRYLIP